MGKKVILLVLLTGGPTLVCHANETPASSWQDDKASANQKVESLYDQGVAATKNNDYNQALSLFTQALNADPNNPSILNMLAHTQRKLGNIDGALDNYKKALELQPNFPEAREYLGEAYIQAALNELETLKGYGDSAKGQADDLTKSFKQATATL